MVRTVRVVAPAGRMTGVRCGDQVVGSRAKSAETTGKVRAVLKPASQARWRAAAEARASASAARAASPMRSEAFAAKSSMVAAEGVMSASILSCLVDEG